MDAPNALRAQAFVRSPEEALRPQDMLALVGQKQIGGAYAEATVALAGTGKADDQALSAEVLTPSGANPDGADRAPDPPRGALTSGGDRRARLVHRLGPAL